LRVIVDLFNVNEISGLSDDFVDTVRDPFWDPASIESVLVIYLCHLATLVSVNLMIAL
tara:strand:+ start:195 stop:368 length:174 start_codon:yes stop_codon:yes gene_type:complete